MADDRVVTELVILGAEQSVRRIESVAQSTSELVTVQEQAGVRQRVVYDQIAQAAERSAQAQEEAAKRAEAAAKRLALTTNLQQPERLQAAVGASQFTAQRARLEAEQQRIQQGLAAQGRTQPTQLMSADRLQVAQQAAAFTAARNAIIAQQQAAQTLQGRLAALGQTVVALAGNLKGLVTSSQQASQALDQQSNAAGGAQRSGITYLSVLSAIHAASFLASNRTFTLVGSFTTLGLAFGKMGVAAGAVGLAFGGILALFGQVTQAIQQIQQAAISGGVALAHIAAVAAAVAVGAGAASVKIAGDVETQLASVRAFGGATTEQLRQVQAQASEFAVQFGVSAADVVQATSLFARAGGSVEDAISGATEAIIRLQVASQGELSAAQAAIAVSAALKQFNLTGDQAVRVADNLAAAAQGSALSFAGVQQAFIQAAPGAANLGITLEDLAAAVALLGDNLVKGTTTGTAFKQFIIDVVNPTDKAKKALAQYGITFEDADKNALGFVDALDQLNKGLGSIVQGTNDAAKAQAQRALVIAFGARAELAANILTREGTQGLQAYREALSQVTTSNIVDVLLLPMQKQLERVNQAAQQLGQAFGGPLLGPIRESLQGAIAFLQQIRPLAELAGQAISVVLTNQGFAALQTAIDNVVGHNALASFLIELVNSARNVRDAFVSQIVPALQDFATTLSTAFGSDDAVNRTASGFENLNRAIQGVAAAVAIGIRAFAGLIVEFVNGTGRGGELRQQVQDIATAIVTNLITSLATTAVFLAAASVAMIKFGQVGLAVANALTPVFKVLADVSNDVGLGFAKLGLEAEKAKISLARNQAAAALDIDTTNKLQTELDGVNAQLAELDRRGQQETPVGRIAAEIANATAGAQTFADELTRLLDPQNIKTQVGETVQVFQDLEGSVTSIFSNIDQVIEQTQRALNNTPSGRQPGAVGGPTEAELRRMAERIAEAGRDVSRRLDNLAQDAAQRVTNIVARALERLDDIKQNTLDRLGDLAQQTQERIADIRRNTSERREDRQAVDDFKKDQEDKFTAFQRNIDKQATSDQRRVEDAARLRQQDTEDASRVVEQQFQDSETIHQRQLAAEQRTFDLIQQIRETAFDRSAQAELNAFQRGQQAAAEARQFNLQLANAKTPEERANLNKQHQQAIQDTKFQQGQEDALTKFRQTQEDKKQKFQRQLETEAIQFRQSQEDVFTGFRRLQETNLIKYRRTIEVKELADRRGDEDALLQLRLHSEDIIIARRRQDALDLQAFTDDIENKRQAEEEARITAKAQEEAQKILRNAEKEANRVIDQAFLQLEEQATGVEAQIRNVIDTLVDLQDQVPPELLGPFLAQLEQARQRAGALKTSLGDAQEAAKLQLSQATAVQGAELQVAAGNLGLLAPTAPTQTPLQQAVMLQAMTVGSLILPPSFNGQVANAIQQGITQVIEQGILKMPDVDLTDVEGNLQAIRRAFRA